MSLPLKGGRAERVGAGLVSVDVFVAGVFASSECGEEEESEAEPQEGGEGAGASAAVAATAEDEFAEGATAGIGNGLWFGGWLVGSGRFDAGSFVALFVLAALHSGAGVVTASAFGVTNACVSAGVALLSLANVDFAVAVEANLTGGALFSGAGVGHAFSIDAHFGVLASGAFGDTSSIGGSA